MGFVVSARSRGRHAGGIDHWRTGRAACKAFRLAFWRHKSAPAAPREKARTPVADIDSHLHAMQRIGLRAPDDACAIAGGVRRRSQPHSFIMLASGQRQRASARASPRVIGEPQIVQIGLSLRVMVQALRRSSLAASSALSGAGTGVDAGAGAAGTCDCSAAVARAAISSALWAANSSSSSGRGR